MSGRRIAHVISTPGGIGGAEKVLIAVAEGAREAGYRYTVINPFDLDLGDSELAGALPEDSYVPNSLPFKSLWRARRWVFERLEEYRPDLIHVQLAHAMVLVASLKRRLKVPLIVSHQHGALFAVNDAVIRRRADRWATHRFDVVVAVSQQVKSFLSEDYGIDPRRIEMIPNGWGGTPLPRFPSAEPTVVTVGGLRPEKGQSVLLNAWVSVVKHVPHAQLILVGDGAERASLERRTRELAIQGTVTFAGVQENIWPFLAAAHVFVLPSFSETSGIAAMEAMAAGLPVVASDVGGLREVVRDGQNGVLVPSNDPEALSKELSRLLTSPIEQENMGLLSRSMAEEWRIDHTVSSYLSLYERLLS